MHLTLDVVGHALGKLGQVLLVLQDRSDDLHSNEQENNNSTLQLLLSIHLFDPRAEVIQRVRMHIPAREHGKEVLLRHGHGLPLDKVHALVLERGRPVRVAKQMAGEVLADHQLLTIN